MTTLKNSPRITNGINVTALGQIVLLLLLVSLSGLGLLLVPLLIGNWAEFGEGQRSVEVAVTAATAAFFFLLAGLVLRHVFIGRTRMGDRLCGALSIYLLLVAYGIAIAWRSRNQFGRLLAMGLTTTFFLYVFINVAMVMGLIPVVGVPLPFISYGGTSLLTLLIGFGLIMSVSIHRDMWINRRGGAP